MRTEPFPPIEDLFGTTAPTGVLYHYTSLGSLLQIVATQQMFASDVGYMNDATETAHTMGLVIEELRRVAKATWSTGDWTRDLALLSPAMQADLRHWTAKYRTYVSCFTKEGSLLSQWRGYCPPHRGVSIGFLADDLRTAAEAQGFKLRECIYDAARQDVIVKSLGERLKIADTPSPAAWALNTVHQSIEAVIKASAVLKHPSFVEEQEWRVVLSPSVPVEDAAPATAAEFREGRSMLIPYRRFQLPKKPDGGLKIERVIVGPTPHHLTALRSVQTFLESQKSKPAKDVEYCDIPLREA